MQMIIWKKFRKKEQKQVEKFCSLTEVGLLWNKNKNKMLNANNKIKLIVYSCKIQYRLLILKTVQQRSAVSCCRS